MRGNNQKLRVMAKRPGFTLLEMVVVVAMFSVVVIAIIDISLLAMRSQQRTAARQQVLTQLRSATETIASHVRTDQVDYVALSQFVNPLGELRLVAPDGSSVRFFVQNDALVQEVTQSGITQQAVLTNPTQVRVEQAQFWIAPTDPQDAVQPHVSMRITSTPVGIQGEAQQRLTIETTITSRLYSR